MNETIKKAAVQVNLSNDDKAEAQESWMRPGETPFDAYWRHKQEQIEMGIGVPHYM